MKKIINIFLFAFFLGISTPLVVANTGTTEVLNEDVFDFSISSDNQLIELAWENVPKNTSEIIIQRSFDGKRYTPVFRSNNTKGLSFQDDLFSLPVDEVNYRFQFILNDGSEVFSNSKFLSLKNQDHLKPTIYLNGGQVNFDFFSSEKGRVTAQVFNSTANLAGEYIFESDKGENSQQFNLHGLRNGLYFLRLELNGKITTTKFFVR